MGVGERCAPRPKIPARLADPEYRAELATAKAWRLTPSQFRALPDKDQAEMLAYETEVCPRCGNLRSVCSDPERDWHPATVTCWPSATTEWALRQAAKNHQDDNVPDDQLHPLDGVSIYATETDPGDPEFS